MLIYIYGTDTFRSRQYLRDQVEKFKTVRDPQGYNVVFLDALKIEAGRILSEILSVPFLAEKRLVVVENILFSKDETLLSALLQRIQTNSLPTSNVVIFWQGDNGGADKKNKKSSNAEKLEKTLLKEKYAQEFKFLNEDQLLVWINQELNKMQATINRAAALFLTRNAGHDLWMLFGVLNQLALYAGTKEIGLSEVKLFLTEKVDDNVFSLVEALVVGNRKQVFKLLADQQKMGGDLFKIFGLIVWQFRLLLQLRSLFDTVDGVTSGAAAACLKIHPFVVKKNWSVIKKYPLDKIKKIYAQLLTIDIKTKTGGGDQSLLLDLFISRN